MYNKLIINSLIKFIKENTGKVDKKSLIDLVQKKFSLVKDGKVYCCADFSIRFSSSKKKHMSNTVLALSKLQKYDKKPFFVCIVTPDTNYILLANTTFLKKISHSSKELRVDNIRGSFNGTDIMTQVNGLENAPSHFEELFAFHNETSFQENLERLVEATNGIVGREQKFEITQENKLKILSAVSLTCNFLKSTEYETLREDLDARVRSVQGEIAIASLIDNVNVRGRVIEYLITDNGSTLKDQIISALRGKTELPQFQTRDALGDYSRSFLKYQTETDIKTKVMFLAGNPKAYNVDKLLEFLTEEKAVYMIYILGIDENGKITSRLCSVFDERLIENTSIIHHWAGRNRRGVAQFKGEALSQILLEKNFPVVDEQAAKRFLTMLIEL